MNPKPQLAMRLKVMFMYFKIIYPQGSWRVAHSKAADHIPANGRIPLELEKFLEDRKHAVEMHPVGR